ncbi:MAG TPA: ribosome-associated translation inhibitor RaiA [Clostridiales bacterium]|nr:ribosome-associated translation inhibitor RaiA [Clostridiales bacterium]
MRFIYTMKNVEFNQPTKDMIEKKLSKLDKFFKGNTEAYITVSKIRSQTNFEVTIPYQGIIFRAETLQHDVLASADKATDILVRQIRRNKTRLEKRLHETVAIDYDAGNVDQERVDEELDFKVVKTKKFPLKPMSVEEAILQMNLLGHQFYMFKNAETNEVNVVYVRKEKDYGLIEPEI